MSQKLLVEGFEWDEDICQLKKKIFNDKKQ